MRGRSSRLIRLTLLVIIVLSFGGAVWLLWEAGQGILEAAAALGPPDPALSPAYRVALTAYLVLNQNQLEAPAGNPDVTVDLEVQPGETAREVATHLQNAGVVHNSLLLRAYLRYHGLDVGVEVGRYQFQGSLTIPQLAEALQTALPSEIALTVPEGWRREQIAERLVGLGVDFTAGEFLAATETRPSGFSFSNDLPEPPSVEGYLFPDTYRLDPEISAAELVLAMLENFDRQIGAELQAAFLQRGLSLHQAVTLASIIEREAVLAEEHSMIASVFYNRLSLGMTLDADPTVQYAVGRQPDDTWWKVALSLEDLDLEHPYNTYLYPGLPPGPIASPGLSALQAVAIPEDSPFLFFRAACDGSGRHLFAVTFEEHVSNACP